MTPDPEVEELDEADQFQITHYDEILREHTRIVMRAYNKIHNAKHKEKRAKRKRAKDSRRRNR